MTPHFVNTNLLTRIDRLRSLPLVIVIAGCCVFGVIVIAYYHLQANESVFLTTRSPDKYSVMLKGDRGRTIRGLESTNSIQAVGLRRSLAEV